MNGRDRRDFIISTAELHIDAAVAPELMSQLSEAQVLNPLRGANETVASR